MSDGRFVGPQPARRGPLGLVVALATVLVLVLCAGGSLALYLMRQGPTPAAQAGPPSGSPSATAPAGDAARVGKGQCVVTEGSARAPKLRVVACAPGSFRVLARLDGTSDTNRCTIVPGSTHDYFYQTTPATSDFVLCLKKQ